MFRQPARAKSYEDSYQVWNYLGAGLTTVWLVATLLFMLGFAYSYFWSAATAVYLNMRQVVDDTEWDEVYLDEEAEVSYAPPPTVTPPAQPPAGAGTALPMVPTAPNLAPAPTEGEQPK